MVAPWNLHGRCHFIYSLVFILISDPFFFLLFSIFFRRRIREKLETQEEEAPIKATEAEKSHSHEDDHV